MPPPNVAQRLTFQTREAFDEAAVLAESKLADNLVHLRVKQARLVTVGLLPGVNISIPIADSDMQGAGKP